MSTSLASLPEELLARVLAFSCTSIHHRNPFAPLLVSRQFFRVAAPLFYHSIRLQSQRQTARILDTFSRNPTLANAVHRIVFAGIWQASAGVLALCDRVYDVDICLDCGPHQQASDLVDDVDAEAFCCALERRRTITHLTIRKDPTIYLTHPRPMYLFRRLAQAAHHWTNLETAHFALRISASPITLPLARALSVAPRLRSVHALLPTVWNNFLLVISTNPRLEKVMLYAEPTLGPLQNQLNTTMGLTVIKGGCICDDIEHAILGTGLYMNEAKKHARLSELIRSGTAIVRNRAHTTIVTLSTPSAGGILLGATRAKELAVQLMAKKSCSLTAGHSFGMATGRIAHAQDV